MSDTIKPETLVELSKLLLRRSDDTLIWLDVIEEILIKQGLTSHDEMRARFEQLKAEYVAGVQKQFLGAVEKQHSEQLLELLRSFEGKPQ